jgi:hypothetical protein
MHDRGVVGGSSHDLGTPDGSPGRNDQAKGNIEGHNPLSNWFSNHRPWTETGEGGDAWDDQGDYATDMSFSRIGSTSTTLTRVQSPSSQIEAHNLKRGSGGHHRGGRGQTASAAVADDGGGQYGWVPDYEMDSAASRTPSWASLNR